MSDLARVRASLAGRYVVERELGRGGMARVYLARDLKHGRHVALKVLSASMHDAAGTERFLREIRTTARLTHPAILPLHDSGEVDGIPFYTMPWVDGSSLRDMLSGGPLPLERAVEIAACVAEALAYAHDAGVIHRDIKPDNILVAHTGHIWVSDFGLAHALAGAASSRLSSGVALGSPHYMSPEQALGEASLTGATDVYSLGCLLFEMLTGNPPFEGPIASVLSRQVTEPSPDIRAILPDVPEHVAAVIDAALAKAPGQRPDAHDVASALKNVHSQPSSSLRAGRRRATRVRGGHVFAAAVMLIAAAGALLLFSGRYDIESIIGGGAGSDTTSYAVLSFAGDSGDAAYRVTQMVSEALGRWDGITLVDQLRVADAETQREPGTAPDLRELSRELGAGRFVRGRVRRDGDSIHVIARVYDARRPKRSIADATVRIPADLAGAEAILEGLADSLVFHGAPSASFGAGVRGTHSAPALRTYLDAHAAMREWDVRRADSLFMAALDIDPGYTRARLWQAQLRFWTGSARSSWSTLADQAAGDTLELNAKERVLAMALSALGQQDFERACALYGKLVNGNPNDFMAQYGLGECLRRDGYVFRDEGSPSGWSFRSSAHRSVEAFRRAFAILPASHRAYRGNTFENIRGVLYTSPTMWRSGKDSSGAEYIAAPYWSDTLAFVPVPRDGAASGASTFDPPSTLMAVRKMRGVFHDVARGWAAAYPSSPAALEAQAVALELIGADSALDVLRSARAAVRDDPDYSVHLLVSELWLRTKRAIPADTAELRAVMHIADSLLLRAGDASPAAAARLASLAALTGRANFAAMLARRGASPYRVSGLSISTSVTAPGGALKAFAAMHGPVDSIRSLEAQVERAIANTFEASARNFIRAEWTVRPATLAFPVYRSPLLTPDVARGDYLLAAQLAFDRGRHDEVRKRLERMRADRASIPASGLSADALYPEAWLAAQIDGPDAAAAYLCPMLEVISLFEPGALNDVAAAGSLPLAMLLFSQAQRSRGAGADADRWHSAVAILWTNADPHLKRALRAPAPFPQMVTTSARLRPKTFSTCSPGG